MRQNYASIANEHLRNQASRNAAIPAPTATRASTSRPARTAARMPAPCEEKGIPTARNGHLRIWKTLPLPPAASRNLSGKTQETSSPGSDKSSASVPPTRARTGTEPRSSFVPLAASWPPRRPVSDHPEAVRKRRAMRFPKTPKPPFARRNFQPPLCHDQRRGNNPLHVSHGLHQRLGHVSQSLSRHTSTASKPPFFPSETSATIRRRAEISDLISNGECTAASARYARYLLRLDQLEHQRSHAISDSIHRAWREVKEPGHPPKPNSKRGIIYFS